MTPADLKTQIASCVKQLKHITVAFKDGKTFSTDDSQPVFKKLVKAIKDRDGKKARTLVNASEAIGLWSEGKLTVDKNDNVLYDGKMVSPMLHKRILQMVHEKASVSYLVKFLENLHLNTHFQNIEDLYEFLESQKLPITEDGCFLAFKRVDGEFKDSYTHRVDNRVGAHVETDHERCNFDRNQTCAGSGYHYAGPNYGFTGVKHIVIKVNPRWVTSIPRYYSNQKGRCSQYDVVADVTNAKADEFFKMATTTTATVSKKSETKPEPKAPKKKAAKKTVKKAAPAKKKVVKKEVTKAKKAAAKPAKKVTSRKTAPAKKAAKTKGRVQPNKIDVGKKTTKKPVKKKVAKKK